MLIGQVSKELGIPAVTIRKLERERKVPLPKRTLMGWRVYSQTDLTNLAEYIRTSRERRHIPNS